MIEIKTKRTGKVIFISDEDLDMADWGWSVSTVGYAYNQRVGLMHRIILARKLGRELLDGEETDHKNRIRHDNQRENLRLSTSSQNKINRPLQSNNTSGYRGVDYSKRHNKWTARIKINGKYTHIGSYESAELAAAAYDKVAKEMQGEFFIGNGMDSETVNSVVVPQKKIKPKRDSNIPTGVYFNKITKKWFAEISRNNKRKKLGHFDTMEEAGLAYAKAAKNIDDLESIQYQKIDIHQNNTSGYRYIYYEATSKKPKKWRVIIRINGKPTSAGRHATLEEAIIARDAKLAEMKEEESLQIKAKSS
jgi:hypothetical protein